MLHRHVPAGFRHSYTVPVSELKDCRTKLVNCEWVCDDWYSSTAF